MKFIMHLTIQNIKRRRVRTILTLLGVMIGVVAVVSLLSLGMGVKRELLQGYGDDASIRQITVQTPENNQNKKMLLTDHTIEKLANSTRLRMSIRAMKYLRIFRSVNIPRIRIWLVSHRSSYPQSR